MKIKNKKTGEIREIKNILIDGMFSVNSLAELNAEWQDYEEPKRYWSYDTFNNDVTFNSISNEDDRKADQEIGNYFETREEAEKAVEKLKAFKRLKDKGFRFIELDDIRCCIQFTVNDLYNDNDAAKDLNLLFGDEE